MEAVFPELPFLVRNPAPSLVGILLLETQGGQKNSVLYNLTLGQILNAKVLEVFPPNRALANFGGPDVMIQYEGELAKGQSFLARVEKLLPAPQLKRVGNVFPQQAAQGNEPLPQISPPVISRLSANQQSNNPQSQIGEGSQKLNLPPGKEIQARVVKVIDSQSALIQFKGETLLAETPGNRSLKPGETVSVRVEGPSDKIQLVLTPENSLSKAVNPAMLKPYVFFKQTFAESAANLRKIMVDNPVLNQLKIPADLVDRIRENLKILFGKSESPPKAEHIAEWVHRSGVNYEAGLKAFLQNGSSPDGRNILRNDLKGQLLELTQKLEQSTRQNSKESSGAPGRQLTEMIHQVKLATNNIELQQLSNQFAKQEHQPVLIHFANPYSANGESVKLYVRNESEGKKSKREHSVTHLTLLLDLTSLGNLRTDAKIKGTEVSVEIQVESTMIEAFISRYIPEIKNRFREIGFTSTVSCCAREKVSQEIRGDLDRLLNDEPSRLVDIKT